MKFEYKIYKNASTCKFDNKRVTVIKSKDDFILEFKSISNAHSPRALCNFTHSKLVTTELRLSEKAAMATMVLLAEQMGYTIIEKT
jgi:hypothetical protein